MIPLQKAKLQQHLSTYSLQIGEVRQGKIKWNVEYRVQNLRQESKKNHGSDLRYRYQPEFTVSRLTRHGTHMSCQHIAQHRVSDGAW